MAREKQRAFWLIVANGSLFTFGSAFINPDIVLPGFVHRLTGSAIAVGLVSAIVNAGWFWPQIFVSNFIEHRPRKMPLYTSSAFVRTGSVLLVAIVLFFTDDPVARTLFPFLAFLIACNATFSGVAGLPFMDIVAKTVDNDQYGILFGIRQLLGGVLACLAGFVVSSVLSERGGLRFPQDFALLFLMSGVICGLAYGCFVLVKEPIEIGVGKRTPFSSHLRRAPALLKNDINYRRMFVVRTLASFLGMGVPFYVPFSIHRLGVGYGSTGIFLSVSMGARIISNLVWTYASYRRTSATLFFLGGIVGVCSPAVALVVSLLGGTSASTECLFALYCVAFATAMAASAAFGIAGDAYLLELAPKEIRPTYVAFMNTLTFPFMFASVLAGVLIRWISYEFVFVLCVVAGILTILEARKIKPVPENG